MTEKKITKAREAAEATYWAQYPIIYADIFRQSFAEAPYGPPIAHAPDGGKR